MSPTEIARPNIRTEAVAGITTFFTMAYIVVVNPSVLATEGTGMAFSGVLTATVLLCFVMTLSWASTQSCRLRWRREWALMLDRVTVHW